MTIRVTYHPAGEQLKPSRGAGNMSDEFFKKVGQRIRQLRLAKGLTQAEFAEAAGMNRRYVSTMETGDKALSLKTLGRASLVLGTSPSSLLDGLMPDSSILETSPRTNARAGAPRRSRTG